MEKLLQKLIEGMEYYAKSFTINGNTDHFGISSSFGSTPSKKEETE